MTVADQIAEWLHEKGIQTIFGIVGAGNIAIFNAIARFKKTEIICQHHEQACVLAAGSFFRVSGRISIALVTTGAGSTNAITGVASCWMDSVPVLIISGNEADKYMYADTRVWGVQGYDSRAMAEQVTKFPAHRINAKAVFQKKQIEMLERAYTSALKPRMGPCWVDVPKDIQNAVV